MEKSKQKLRYILQYYFDQGTNAAQACKKICGVYGDGTLTEAAAQKWFARFRCGNFDVEDAPRSGRPSIERVDEILEQIKQDPHTTTAEIAKDLNVNQKTVWNHLVKAGFEKRLDIWVPRDLTQKNLIDRINICESLLKRNEIDPFLKHMITGDIRFIVCDNNVRKRSWSQRNESLQNLSKAQPHRMKFILSVWWDCEGVIYWELLPVDRTLNSELYCEQLIKLKQSLEETRPRLKNDKCIAFYHDNNRPYNSLATCLKRREFGWETLLHPPNSPDLSPSNYHLLKSLQESLNSNELNTQEACQAHIEFFFAQKPQDFYSVGIMALPDKWRKVVNNNGDYLV